jgi:hypothetical protein
MAVAASPVAAQHRREGGENRGNGGDGGNASPRAEQRPQPRGERSQAQPRAESRPAQPQPQPQSQPQAQPRVEQRQAQPRYGEQRAVPREDYRRENRPEYRGDSRGDYRGNYAVPRTYAAPRYVGPRSGGYAAPRYYTGRYYGPRYVGPSFAYAPRRFYRPYYVFRPRFSISFGIWAGYPITYYDPFYYPYDYYPYASGPAPLPAPGSVAVQPNQGSMGGVSFDITPSTAEIWVDGNYYGTVDQFTASSQPLGLPAGRHHIELREPGYQVSSFEVDIVPGQVIPFQGQLEP